MRKTPPMLAVEERYNKPLEKLLPEMYNDKGGNLSAMAAELGINVGTLAYWLLKVSISVQRTTLAPDEELTVGPTHRK